MKENANPTIYPVERKKRVRLVCVRVDALMDGCLLFRLSATVRTNNSAAARCTLA